MKKYLLLLAALSVVMAGCGKDEEPMPKEEPTAQEETVTETETAMAEGETMADGEAAAEGEAMAEGEAAATEEAPAEEAAATEETTATAEAGKGKQIYDSVCFVCHAQGVAGAPKLDDKAAWAPRIAKGMDTLVSHAVNGFQGEAGVMPPKGGRMDLSNEDVAAAVSYMVEQAK